MKAFGGLIALGRLEVVPEPGRTYDDPVIYRLLPAEARSATVMHPCSSLDAKTQDTAVPSSTLLHPIYSLYPFKC